MNLGRNITAATATTTATTSIANRDGFSRLAILNRDREGWQDYSIPKGTRIALRFLQYVHEIQK